MRQHFLRTLIVLAALVALGLSPFRATIPHAAACSNEGTAGATNGGCTISVPISSVIDTYVSPISVSSATATMAERATSAQVHSLTLAGSLDFTVLDARGNNQGFVASVSSGGFTSSLFPLLPIAGGALTVSGTPDVMLTCYGPYGCGQGVGLRGSAGGSLGAPLAVAAECPAESIGEGQYAVSVPLTLSLSGLQAEKFGSYPATWFGTFSVSVTEGQDVNSFASYGCPAFSTGGGTTTTTTSSATQSATSSSSTAPSTSSSTTSATSSSTAPSTSSSTESATSSSTESSTTAVATQEGTTCLSPDEQSFCTQNTEDTTCLSPDERSFCGSGEQDTESTEGTTCLSPDEQSFCTQNTEDTTCLSSDERSFCTITIGLSPRSLASGNMLLVRIHTTPHAHVGITLQVMTKNVTRTDKERQRTRVMPAVVRYRVIRQGTTNASGQFLGRLRITYAPQRPMPALLTVTVRSTHHNVTRTAWVMIQPQRHQHHT